MMNLVLVRHGLTDWVGHRLAGWTPGVQLNDEGRAQAADLARQLTAVLLAAIYSSPLERALETAQPLADALGLPIQVRDGLGEVRCGDWTGRAIKELRGDPLWPLVQVYPSGTRFPGGESVREAQARMVVELDAIRDTHPNQTVAVFSHADPIRLAVAHYTGLPLDLFQRLAIEPASITALAFARFSPRLLCLNYTASLPSFKLEEPGETEEQ